MSIAFVGVGRDTGRMMRSIVRVVVLGWVVGVGLGLLCISLQLFAEYSPPLSLFSALSKSLAQWI